MGYRELTLQETQNASLRVLEFFDRFCSEHNFQYWVYFGTLIGAIRHKGFIPWDDDIDVAMKRDDYERMLSLIKEKPDVISPFALHHYTVNKYYPHYIVRICDDQRYYLSFSGKNYTSGVFIDVYPFDDIGNDIDYWKKSVPYFEHIKKGAILACYEKGLYGENTLHKIGNIPYMVYAKLRGRDYFLNIIHKKSIQFNGSHSGNIGLTAWTATPRKFSEKLFENFIRIKFEDIEVYAPAEYDQILTSIYGDYLELPDEKDRVAHHRYTAYEIV